MSNGLTNPVQGMYYWNVLRKGMLFFRVRYEHGKDCRKKDG